MSDALIKHRGAVGQSTDTRSQHKNKVIAFERMAKSKEFKQWHRIECARRSGDLEQMEREVERSMQLIKVEVKDEKKWVEVDKNAPIR